MTDTDTLREVDRAACRILDAIDTCRNSHTEEHQVTAGAELDEATENLRQALATLSKPEPAAVGEEAKAAMRGAENALSLLLQYEKIVLSALTSDREAGSAAIRAFQKATAARHNLLAPLYACPVPSGGAIEQAPGYHRRAPSEAISPPDARAVVEAAPSAEGVTQADRDAAASYWKGWSNNVPEVNGEIHPLVYAFAAHRRAALQSGARK